MIREVGRNSSSTTSLPPSASSLWHSDSAFALSGKLRKPNAHTISENPFDSSIGRLCASPVRYVTFRTPESFSRAMSSISGVRSAPMISASGQRRASSMVKSPVPQARSNILHPSGNSMCFNADRRHRRSIPSDIILFMVSYLSAILANRFFIVLEKCAFPVRRL